MGFRCLLLRRGPCGLLAAVLGMLPPFLRNFQVRVCENTSLVPFSFAGHA